MKFDILSNINQDQWDSYPGIGDNDVLVLPGDLGDSADEAISVLRYFSNFYKHVLYVDGNREFFNNPHIKEERYYLEAVRKHIVRNIPKNVHYLSERGPFVSDDGQTVFIGVNGWYLLEMPSDGKYMEDWHSSNNYKFIFSRPWASLSLGNINHIEYMNFFEQMYCTRHRYKNVVVVTHTIPSESIVKRKFKNKMTHYSNIIDDATRTLYPQMGESIGIACFGKNNFSCDFSVKGPRYTGKTRFICNPRTSLTKSGKTRENKIKSVEI